MSASATHKRCADSGIAQPFVTRVAIIDECYCSSDRSVVAHTAQTFKVGRVLRPTSSLGSGAAVADRVSIWSC
ncbi:hypothetical protein M514_00442 [Trichuris suis]|uniref:Uncharacterized protein n=1 Tax=Trichuris suis TaxID=68888 RepID=A0A085NRD3_9BILA|nr:hypothetical protein M513_00442 [Trichuris suis]KFD72029.1 hypothetical protein M514_00442 [Trichuris suis]